MKLLKNHLGALIAWIAILLIAVFSLPNVDALTRQHSEISLPKDVQSSIATNIESKWGHGQDNTYVVGVVFNKKHGKLTSSDKEKIDNTIRFLKDNKKKLGIKSMMTPNDNYATKAQLISKDKTTEIVQLNIANDHSTVSNVNKTLTKAVKTPGVRTYVTGVRILEDDFSASVQDGIIKTELITIFSAKTCLSALDEIVSMRGTRWGGYFLIESASNNSVSHKIIRVSKKEIETEKKNWQWRLIYGRGK